MRDTIKTKTFWTAIASIATGVGLIYAGEKTGGMQMIAAAIMAICLRDGIKKAE